jgi:hypothetical protein
MLIIAQTIKLGKAYETLKDECKRREYDRQYSENKSKSTTQPSNTSYSTPHKQPTTKNDEVDTSKERAGIAAILKAKATCAAQWSKTRKVYEDAIFELQREVRKLQVAIREVDDKEKQVEAEEAAKNSWTAWMLRPIYGAPIETEEEKESKSRERLGRMHSKDIKERELKRKEQELKEWAEQFRAKEREKEAADKKHDADRATLEAAIWLKNEMLKQQRERVEREANEKARRERMEKERVEREAAAKAWREELEKQRKETEARERAWREQREKDKREAAAQQRARREKQDKEAQQRERDQAGSFRNRGMRPSNSRYKSWETRDEPATTDFPFETFSAAGSAFTARSACTHDHWWNKTEGRTNCESCGVLRFNYFMQCPGCNMKACPDCMHSKLRPRKRNSNRTKTNQGQRYEEARRSDFGYNRDWDRGYD